MIGRQLAHFEITAKLGQGGMGEVTRALAKHVPIRESSTTAAAPTDNLEAYQAYLQGIVTSDYEGYGGEHQRSIALFQQAVALDPGFMLAWAEMSMRHSNLFNNGDDRTAERGQMSLEAAERAVELDPDSATALVALGKHRYHVEQDYDRALELFQRARRINPNEAGREPYEAFIVRRRLRPEEALAIPYIEILDDFDELREQPGWAELVRKHSAPLELPVDL